LRPLWPAPGRVASRWLAPYLEGDGGSLGDGVRLNALPAPC
jgi:hypothetical protein